MEDSYFVYKITSTGKKIKFITKTTNGKVIEMEMWEMVNRYGPEKVLQMRIDLPEIEEK